MSADNIFPENPARKSILLLCRTLEVMMSDHQDIYDEVGRVCDLRAHEKLRIMLGGTKAIHDQAAATIDNIRRELQ